MSNNWTPIVKDEPSPLNEKLRNYQPPFILGACVIYWAVAAIILIGFTLLVWYGWMYAIQAPPFGPTPVTLP